MALGYLLMVLPFPRLAPLNCLRFVDANMTWNVHTKHLSVKIAKMWVYYTEHLICFPSPLALNYITLWYIRISPNVT